MKNSLCCRLCAIDKTRVTRFEEISQKIDELLNVLRNVNVGHRLSISSIWNIEHENRSHREDTLNFRNGNKRWIRNGPQSAIALISISLNFFHEIELSKVYQNFITLLGQPDVDYCYNVYVYYPRRNRIRNLKKTLYPFQIDFFLLKEWKSKYLTNTMHRMLSMISVINITAPSALRLHKLEIYDSAGLLFSWKLNYNKNHRPAVK